jgi:transcription initiation factor TFIID subunit 5
MTDQTVDFHPNCNYIISGSIDKCARMWDVNSGNCVRIFTGHSASLYSSCVSKDGRLAFTGGDDKDIIAWDLASSKRVGVLKGHTGTIWSLDVSGEGSLLASGSADNTVRLWDLRMLRSPEPSDADKSPLVATYHTKNTPVYKVAFTQRNLLLAGGPFRPPNPAE